MPESNERGALTEAVYLILISLQDELHGYGIMQKVTEMSNRRVNLGAGTLYGALNTLVKKQYIKQVENGKESRKKMYMITDLGTDVLKGEIKRLKELISIGENNLKEIK